MLCTSNRACRYRCPDQYISKGTNELSSHGDPIDMSTFSYDSYAIDEQAKQPQPERGKPLEWLITLMCPLMMLPMIFLMIKGNKPKPPASDDQQTKMKEELEILKNQNSSMREMLEQVKQKRNVSR